MVLRWVVGYWNCGGGVQLRIGCWIDFGIDMAGKVGVKVSLFLVTWFHELLLDRAEFRDCW